MRKLLVVLMAVPLMLAGCSEGDSSILAPEAANLSFIGFEGTTEDVPKSAVADGIAYDFAFPSTNASNIGSGWANVTWNSNDAGIGEAPLAFTSTRGFVSCFEYRIDDAATTDPRDNFNTHVADGLWPFVCTNDSTVALDLTANSHVDVRMAFGAERDERFDWTRFYVMSLDSKDQCKDGGWQALGFRNQGQCIRFVETGQDSR